MRPLFDFLLAKKNKYGIKDNISRVGNNLQGGNDSFSHGNQNRTEST